MTDTATVTDTGEDEAPAISARAGRNAYRSYFSFAPRPDSLELVLGQFGTWLRERKDIDVELIDSFVGEFDDRTLLVAHNEKKDGHQARCTLIEKGPRQYWRTEMTFFVPARAGRGWLNLTVASDTIIPAEPPNVFGQIVDVLDDPRDGALPLRSEPPVVVMSQVDEVVEWVTDTDRHALLFVAGSGHELQFGAWVAKVRQWARGMRGMAQTVILDPDATTELAGRLGPSHEVRPWNIRTFQPDALIGQRSDGPRHRILSAQRLGADTDAAIRRLLQRVARQHANDRATPPALARATRDLDRVTTALTLDRIFEPDTAALDRASLDGVVDLSTRPADDPAAVPELGPADSEWLDDGKQVPVEHNVAELRELIAAQSFQLDVVAAVLGPVWTRQSLEKLAGLPSEYRLVREHYDRDRVVLERSREELERSLNQADDLRAEVERLRGELRAEEEERTLEELLRVQAEDETRWLRGEFRNLQRYDLATAQMPRDRETDIPLSFDDLVDRLPELVERGVMFTGDEAVARSLSDLDSSGKFALTAWESLLTLCSYLEARRSGDFGGNVKSYLDDTPAGYRRHPPGKHASGESGATMERYGHLRVFPVPIEADSSYRALMAAHFRLGKAGMRSPRMHYLDHFSTSEKVYVGYVGPHLKTVTTN